MAATGGRAQTVSALRAGLTWLLALEGRAAQGQEGSAIKAREVAIEIAAVTRDLAALGADPAGGEAVSAGVRFVPS